MENRQSIILWDLSANRLQAMEANARMAMEELPAREKEEEAAPLRA